MQSAKPKFKSIMRSWKHAIADAEDAKGVEFTAARRSFNDVHTLGKAELVGGGSVSSDVTTAAREKYTGFKSDYSRWSDMVGEDGFHTRSDPELDRLSLSLLGYTASPF